MNASEFVTAIRSEVQESATDETMSLLQRPPGRRPAPSLASLSHWFDALPEADRQRVREVAAMASHRAVFGFLAVLDGVRVIEDEAEKGTFELRYLKGERVTLVTDPSEPPLHDILQEQGDRE
jgi:hypothetical protein